ncbi:MAG: MlaD family protein [Bacteroidia bacterium]
MKISNEVKFGIFAILAIAAFIIGMSYLKGSSLFGTKLTLKAMYSNAEGLIPGNPVKIKGVKVGRIDNMELVGDSVKVEFSLDPYRMLPADSRAEIYSISILGEMGIKIVSGKSSQLLEEGQTISSDIEPGMIEDITSKVTESELVDNLTKLSKELSDLGKKLNQSLGGEEGQPSKLDGIVKNLEATTNRTELLMKELTKTATNFSKLADNTNTIMAEVASQKDGLSGSVTNLKTLTDSLAAASGNIKTLAEGANSAVSNLSSVLDKVNSPNGSLGKLINDESLYESLESVTAQTSDLITAIQTNPAHFRKMLGVKVSVFPNKDRRSKDVIELQNQYDAKMLEVAIDSLEN